MDEEEVARFGRTFQEFMLRISQMAGTTTDSAVRDLIDRHLQVDTEALPVVSQSFPSYDHVNVQVAMSAYLGATGRSHELVGFIGQQRHYGSLSDVIEMARYGGVRIGSVDLVNLPIGPEETLPCVQFGLFLIFDGTDRLVVLMRGPREDTPQVAVSLEIVAAEERVARSFLEEIRRLMVELNVFRGQMLSFGESQMGRFGVGPIVFHRRPEMERDQLVMGPGLLESIEREVLGVARHRDRLRASGQHVKRGLLLHGPPGTGKTHTVRYIVGQVGSHTVVLLTGGGLVMVRTACSLARLLQPAVVVLEDVDLVAEERGMYPGMSNPLLFDVLNEMDGMAEDADVVFLLTTNRVDLLEPALAARPGRVDMAIEIPLPDADARRRLIELYGRGLDLRLGDVDGIVSKTEGVTASFVKELLRKAALIAAEHGDGDGTITVTDAEAAEALDELLAERSQLTRVLLGGHGRRPDRAGSSDPRGWEPHIGRPEPSPT
jgi:cell division protease FtsH